MRRAKVSDLARRFDDRQAPAWGINASLQDSDALEPTRISIGQIPEYPGRRLLRLNGVNATGTQLAERLNLMWLTPAQDRLLVMASQAYAMKSHARSATACSQMA